MAYVVRNTLTPKYDCNRNWSGWIGMDYESEIEAIEENIHSINVKPSWFGLNARDLGDDYVNDDVWNACDLEDWNAFLQVVADYQEDVDIRLNLAWGDGRSSTTRG